MRSQVARNPNSATTRRNLQKLLVDVFEEATTRGYVVGLGERIKQARQEAGLTQDQLADLVGVGMRQIQYYESGESDPYRKLRQIAEATGKPIDWLLRGDEDDATPQGELEERLDRLEGMLSEVLRRLDSAEGSQA